MYEQLKKHILQFATPTQDILNEFYSLLEYEQIKKKDFLLKEGQYCEYKYFVLKGCFRSFFINEKGQEKILNFGIENWWITDYESFSNSSPTNLFIQAVETYTVLKITKDNLDKILDHSLELKKYFRIIMEKVRIADQKRIYYMFNLSGKELYDLFCTYYPEFLQRIPQFMMASYLGLTPEFIAKLEEPSKVISFLNLD